MLSLCGNDPKLLRLALWVSNRKRKKSGRRKGDPRPKDLDAITLTSCGVAESELAATQHFWKGEFTKCYSRGRNRALAIKTVRKRQGLELDQFVNYLKSK